MLDEIGIVKLEIRNIPEGVAFQLRENAFWATRYEFVSGHGSYRIESGSSRFVEYEFHEAWTESGRSITLSRVMGDKWKLSVDFGTSEGRGSEVFANRVIGWLQQCGLEIAHIVELDNEDVLHDVFLETLLTYYNGVLV